MLSPAHSDTNSSGSGSNTNSSGSGSSSSESSPNPMLAPRTVADHLANLGRALDHEFYVEDPGRAEVFHHMGFFIGPNNKRRLVFYVAHGMPATARRLTRVDYTMPVDTITATLLFGGDGETVLPPVGPNITQLDVPADQTAATFVAAEIAGTAGRPAAERLAAWDAEITRVEGVRDNAAEPAARRQGASNIVRFWRQMRQDIGAILFARVQRADVPAPASPPAPPPSPVVAAAAAGPVTPVATSSSERRRRSQRRRNAAAAANRNRNRNTRKKTPDPNNGLGYTRDPVTGKLTRRRRPESDPQ